MNLIRFFLLLILILNNNLNFQIIKNLLTKSNKMFYLNNKCFKENIYYFSHSKKELTKEEEDYKNSIYKDLINELIELNTYISNHRNEYAYYFLKNDIEDSSEEIKNYKIDFNELKLFNLNEFKNYLDNFYSNKLTFTNKHINDLSVIMFNQNILYKNIINAIENDKDLYELKYLQYVSKEDLIIIKKNIKDILFRCLFIAKELEYLISKYYYKNIENKQYGAEYLPKNLEKTLEKNYFKEIKILIPMIDRKLKIYGEDIIAIKNKYDELNNLCIKISNNIDQSLSLL